MADQTGWNIQGLDLRRVGYNLDTVAGWDSFPGQRAQGFEFGYQHGVKFDQRGFYRSKLLPLRITVMPFDADGSFDYSVTDPAEYVQANIESIMGSLHSIGNLLVTRTMPDADVRTIEGRVIGAAPWGNGPGIHGRTIGLVIECPYPFFQGNSQQSQTGETGAFIAANNGNAPLNNMVVTFNSAGILTHDASGDFIQATEAGVVADVGARTAMNGSVFKDNRFRYNAAWWIEMQPGDNDFTVSGGGDIDITWYHSWF